MADDKNILPGLIFLIYGPKTTNETRDNIQMTNTLGAYQPISPLQP